jgi:hypothetical protein
MHTQSLDFGSRSSTVRRFRPGLADRTLSPIATFLQRLTSLSTPRSVQTPG